MWANVTKLDRQPFYKCYLPPWDQFKGKTIGENKRRGGGWPSVSGTPLYVHKSQIQGQVKWAPLKGIQMFALWNLSFDLFFLYDVGGGWVVGEGGRGFVSAT